MESQRPRQTRRTPWKTMTKGEFATPKAVAAKRHHGVGSLTPEVKGSTRNPATVRNAMEALAAADLFVTRLVPHLSEVAVLYRAGDERAAAVELKDAVEGIGFLADLINAVGRATGIEPLPSGDHELGRVALALQAIRTASDNQDLAALVAHLEEELIPALARLQPAIPGLEARVAAYA